MKVTHTQQGTTSSPMTKAAFAKLLKEKGKRAYSAKAARIARTGTAIQREEYLRRPLTRQGLLEYVNATKRPDDVLTALAAALRKDAVWATKNYLANAAPCFRATKNKQKRYSDLLTLLSYVEDGNIRYYTALRELVASAPKTMTYNRLSRLLPDVISLEGLIRNTNLIFENDIRRSYYKQCFEKTFATAAARERHRYAPNMGPTPDVWIEELCAAYATAIITGTDNVTRALLSIAKDVNSDGTFSFSAAVGIVELLAQHDEGQLPDAPPHHYVSQFKHSYRRANYQYRYDNGYEVTKEEYANVVAGLFERVATSSAANGDKEELTRTQSVVRTDLKKIYTVYMSKANRTRLTSDAELQMTLAAVDEIGIPLTYNQALARLSCHTDFSKKGSGRSRTQERLLRYIAKLFLGNATIIISTKNKSADDVVRALWASWDTPASIRAVWEYSGVGHVYTINSDHARRRSDQIFKNLHLSPVKNEVIKSIGPPLLDHAVKDSLVLNQLVDTLAADLAKNNTPASRDDIQDVLLTTKDIDLIRRPSYNQLLKLCTRLCGVTPAKRDIYKVLAAEFKGTVYQLLEVAEALSFDA